MLNGDLRARILQYITERQCKSGGFCFYRLEEPNGSDTYFALATLHLLGEFYHDNATAHFLKDAQAPDGSYHNLYQAYYTIRGLRFMNERPRHEPHPYLRTQINRYSLENAESETVLKRLDYLTELCEETHSDIPLDKRKKIVEFILSFRKDNGGFGAPISTLLTTSYAVKSLKRLGFPLTSQELSNFLETCEHPIHGFLNLPDMAPSFLEHIHAGLEIATALGRAPRYSGACREFLLRCQAPNGGFARASRGLPSLSDTFLAVHALKLLGEKE